MTWLRKHPLKSNKGIEIFHDQIHSKVLTNWSGSGNLIENSLAYQKNRNKRGNIPKKWKDLWMKDINKRAYRNLRHFNTYRGLHQPEECEFMGTHSKDGA